MGVRKIGILELKVKMQMTVIVELRRVAIAAMAQSEA